MELQIDHTLDLRGKVCPWLVLGAKAELAKMNGGAVLQLVCDDEHAERDLQNYVRQSGHTLVSLSRDKADSSKVLRFLIRKKAALLAA
jgi:tRNA 2-thiouridine synthesizing protein A